MSQATQPDHSSRFAARSAKLFTIGKVLSLLNPEFPDLMPSKLRFLEEQGLVTPQRTASGYRKFTEQDVERLKIVLELQRDKYLPLKVIREFLNDLDEGRQPQLPGSEPLNTTSIRVVPMKFSLEQLIEETAITTELIEQAQEAALIGQEPFAPSDVAIARSLVHLSRFGLTPRHLRGIKLAVDRDAAIIQGVVAPVLRKNDTGSRSRAAHYALEIDNQFSVIRAELMRSLLGEIDA
jgi:DNA-binding transcriptional MerR regulator